MGFLRDHGFTQPTENIQKFLKDISINGISGEAYIKDIVFEKPIRVEHPSLAISADYSHIFSKITDKKTRAKRQETIKGLSKLLKKPGAHNAFYAFTKSTEEIGRIKNKYDRNTNPEWRALGEAYSAMANSIKEISKYLKKEKGLSDLAEDFSFLKERGKSLVKIGRAFNKDGGSVVFPDNRPTRIIKSYNEIKSKSTPIDTGGLEDFQIKDAAMAFELHDIFERMEANIKFLYIFANYINQKEGRNEPICFPEINGEGIFKVSNGNPIATPCATKDIFPLEEKYNRENNHIIYSGAHDGGKTHRISTIGLYHLYGLAGAPLPCSNAQIPEIENFYAIMERENVTKGQGKGSLESEISDTLALSARLTDNDLLLLDEFLDTTKPELTKYLSVPILQEFGKSKSAIHIVYHAAQPIIEKETSFRFKHPEIKYKMIRDTIWDKLLEKPVPKGKRYREYYATFNFLNGLPNRLFVRKHTEQHYNSIKEELSRINF